jgi:hypothetical protein
VPFVLEQDLIGHFFVADQVLMDTRLNWTFLRQTFVTIFVERLLTSRIPALRTQVRAFLLSPFCLIAPFSSKNWSNNWNWVGVDGSTNLSSTAKCLFTRQIMFVSYNTFQHRTAPIRIAPIMCLKVSYNVGSCCTTQKNHLSCKYTLT